MKKFLNKLQNTFLLIYKKYKNNKIFNLFLYFLSLLFLAGYKLRLVLYKLKILKTYKLPAYVISIGNISSGGTGKTTLVMEIAKHLIAKDYKVAILSRGYKRNIEKNDGVILVSDGEDIITDYDRAGDEPYLIARKVPKALVLVYRNRVQAGMLAINRFGVNALILDDGFQYLKLERDENILILDSYNPFDNNQLLPLGTLRELPESMKRSTTVLLSNSDRKKLDDSELNIINKYGKNKSILKFSYKLTELKELNTKKTLAINNAKNLKAIACCGIGNPESFIDLLKRNEINIIDSLFFPDHYNYQFEDIEKMVSLAQKNNIENIIVTEKDAVKIEDLCQALPVSFWTANIEIIWDTADPFSKLFTTTYRQ